MEIKELVSKEEIIAIPIVPREFRYYQTYNLDDAYEQGWNDLQECIENLPPVQPKRGKWIRDGSNYYCSECKKFAHIDYNKWDVFSPGVWILSDFCSNCGADMRGKTNGTC